jgi:hypothetical protein
LEVITGVHHFQLAELLRDAATVLIKALLALTEMDREVPDESLLLSIWTVGPLPSTIDINVRLLLRALQIGLADKQGAEFSGLLDDLDRLMVEAQPIADAQFGRLAAGGSITIRFARKYPSIANRYLLEMLRSAPQALLPDGTTPEQNYPMSLESILWVGYSTFGPNSRELDKEALWDKAMRGYPITLEEMDRM